MILLTKEGCKSYFLSGEYRGSNQILAITGRPSSLIEYVTDRPGHDRRYALSSAKLIQQTGWIPQMDFERGLAATVEWYRANPEWVQHVRSGEYQTYYARNYEHRTRELKGITTS